VRNTLQPFAKAGAREIAAGNLQPAAYGIGHPRVPQPPFSALLVISAARPPCPHGESRPIRPAGFHHKCEKGTCSRKLHFASRKLKFASRTKAAETRQPSQKYQTTIVNRFAARVMPV
jgi:hypothetical protein